MSWTTPNFNLLGSLWDADAVPSTAEPNAVNIPVQLYTPSRGLLDIQYGEPTLWVPPVYARFPKTYFEEWRDFQIIEAPAGEGRYYRARWKEPMHQGFPNEYLCAVVDQCTDAGVASARFIGSIIVDPDPDPDPSPGEGGSDCSTASDTLSADGDYALSLPALAQRWWKYTPPSGGSFTTLNMSLAPTGPTIAWASSCPFMGFAMGPSNPISYILSSYWVALYNSSASPVTFTLNIWRS